MPSPVIHKAEAFEDSGVSLMARVVGTASTAIAQADLSSITYGVFGPSGSTVVSAGTSLTISDVVFDTLQTDARWTKDTSGYNFRYDVASTELPNGNSRYDVEIKFTPASGEPFHVVWQIKTIDLVGS